MTTKILNIPPDDTYRKLATVNGHLYVNHPPAGVEQCAKCGACTAVCPVYQATGRESHSARGRLHLLSRRLPATRTSGLILSACLLCGACREVCPRKIDTLGLLIAARQRLPGPVRHRALKKLVVRKTLASPLLLAGLGRLRQQLLRVLPQASGLWMKLALLPQDYSPPTAPAPLPGSGSRNSSPALNYFSGCLARYLNPEIGAATAYLAGLATRGGSLLSPESQTCCGLAAFSSGNRDEAQELARQNIKAFSDNTLPILTSCASCYLQLRSYPRLLADDPQWTEAAKDFSERVREFSSYFLEETLLKAPSGPDGNRKNHGALRIYYHDPCHLRFGEHKIISQPRQLISRLTGHPPLELPHGARCCGQGGLFQLAHPDLAHQIFSALLAEFLELSAPLVVTTCSGCLLQWQHGLKQAGFAPRASHLAVLLASTLQR